MPFSAHPRSTQVCRMPAVTSAREASEPQQPAGRADGSHTRQIQLLTSRLGRVAKSNIDVTLINVAALLNGWQSFVISALVFSRTHDPSIVKRKGSWSAHITAV